MCVVRHGPTRPRWPVRRTGPGDEYAGAAVDAARPGSGRGHAVDGDGSSDGNHDDNDDLRVNSEGRAVTEDQSAHHGTTDVALIGAGVMSATLGAILRRLQPEWSIDVFERLDGPALESSDAWNNAGTGHSALCELNYSPRTPDGGVDVSKAVGVNEKFQVSRQFWTYAVENNMLGDPTEWIRQIPHMSFVTGTDGQEYLRKRYDALSANPLFPGMHNSTDPADLERLVPLMARGRDPKQPVALSWFDQGTDVDFGSLTRQLMKYLTRTGTDVHYQSQVKNLDRNSDGTWRLTVVNRNTGDERTVDARFVFVGAGGGALHLLQKSGIPEIRGIGGFPVGGQWLRCTNPELIDEHRAKVYSQASVGAPPMSVPHLDTRVIDGRRGLLFGPFAGWTPKFLKKGSFFDLPGSVRPDNLKSMLGVGMHEMGLVKYLVTELAKTHSARVESLREFMPDAQDGDWEKVIAGQRVQVIKPAAKGGGTLEFGTATVASADGSIAGLLGASPGASTAVDAMVDLIKRCFPSKYAEWTPALEEMIPSLGRDLEKEPALFTEQFDRSSKVLKLDTRP